MPRSALSRAACLLALASALAACSSDAGTQPPHGQGQAIVRYAPADIVTLARRAAQATVRSVHLRWAVLRGSHWYSARTLGRDRGAFGDDYAYDNIVEWSQMWRMKTILPNGMSALMVANDNPEYLAPGNRWFARRDLVLSVTANEGSFSTVRIAARVVWISRFLRVPPTAESVTVVATPQDKVLDRVDNAATVGRISADVDSLVPDEIPHWVGTCLKSPPTALRLVFADARRRTVAVLQSGWCPPVEKLSVPGYGSIQFSSPGIVSEITDLLNLRLPAVPRFSQDGGGATDRP